MEISLSDWIKIVTLCFTICSSLISGVVYFVKRESIASENFLKLEIEKDSTEKFKSIVERQFMFADKLGDIDHKYSQAISELSLGSKETSRRIESIELTLKEMGKEVTEVDRKIDILIARQT